MFGGTVGEELEHLPYATTRVVEHSPEYLRTLLLLLLAATFFEGYDGAILALVLPAIRDTFNVAESQLGVSRAIIELGLGGAFFLARAGDRWGRRTLLLWSVLGYTVMTATHRRLVGPLVVHRVPVALPGLPGGRVRGRGDDDRRGVPEGAPRTRRSGCS